jgi:hypothetical protein
MTWILPVSAFLVEFQIPRFREILGTLGHDLRQTECLLHVSMRLVSSVTQTLLDTEDLNVEFELHSS